MPNLDTLEPQQRKMFVILLMSISRTASRRSFDVLLIFKVSPLSGLATKCNMSTVLCRTRKLQKVYPDFANIAFMCDSKLKNEPGGLLSVVKMVFYSTSIMM